MTWHPQPNLSAALRAEDPETRVLGDIPPVLDGLSSPDLPEHAIAHERRIRLGKPGEYVAYYTGAEAAVGHIIPEKRLRLSSFDRMKDPRENRDWVTLVAHRGQPFTTSSPEAARELLDKMSIDAAKLRERANFHRARHAKLLCLTTESSERSATEDFERAYARPRMWEQYADDHAGVCLVFDREEMNAELKRSLGRQGQLLYDEVRYDNEAIMRAVITANALHIAGPEPSEDALKVLVFEHLAEHQKSLLFLKMSDYRDEREVRYVVLDGRDCPFAYADLGDSLRVVVLGDVFPEELVSTAEEAARTAGVAIRKMMWTPWGPRAFPLDVWREVAAQMAVERDRSRD